MEDLNQYGIYQAEAVLQILDPQLNLIQLIMYIINFLLIALLVYRFKKSSDEIVSDSLRRYYLFIHVGLFLMAMNDLIVAISRYITNGEFAMLGHSKAIFYITGFMLFALGWALKIDRFIRIPRNVRIIIKFIIFIYVIVSSLTILQIILVLVGYLDPNSGLLNLGNEGNFYATIISTLILLTILLILFKLVLDKRKTSKYQMFYSLIQFISLFIVIIFLIIRGYAVSVVDRSVNPELYILLEYKIVTFASLVLPTSLYLLEIYLFQPGWLEKLIVDPQS